MTAPRFTFDRSTGALLGLGPDAQSMPIRCRIADVPTVADRWRRRGHHDAAAALEAAAMGVTA